MEVGVEPHLFNHIGVHIVVYAEAVMTYGRAMAVDEAKCALEHVHREDLASMCEIVMMLVLRGSGRQMSSGKNVLLSSLPIGNTPPLDCDGSRATNRRGVKLGRSGGRYCSSTEGSIGSTSYVDLGRPMYLNKPVIMAPIARRSGYIK